MHGKRKLRLREIREDRGLGVGEMASRLGVAPRTYRSWEYGEHYPSLFRARDCAIILECSIDDIVGYDAHGEREAGEAALLRAYRSMNRKGRELARSAVELIGGDPGMHAAVGGPEGSGRA